MPIFIIPRWDQSAEITNCLTEIKFKACKRGESIALILLHAETLTMLLSSLVACFLFLYILMEQSGSPAREVNTCQWAPHELQAACAQDLGSLELLQTDRFPSTAGTFSLGLSTGVHVVFPWGAASRFGNKDKLSQELFSLCGYCEPGRWKHLPVMNTQVPERERERSDGEGIHISKKIAHFRPSPLQRTRMIRKEPVQDQEEQ